MSNEKLISICCTGDLEMDEPGPMEQYFEGTKDLLTSQDLVIAHVEIPHTTMERAQLSCLDVQALPANPEHLNILKDLGIEVATCASNHTYDCGPNGVIDTIAKLKSLGIKPVGAGETIMQAKEPAIVERQGIKIGVLAYNAAGPKMGWACSYKPGTNYIDVLTSYTPAQDMPGCPAKVYTFIKPEVLDKMKSEIAELKKKVDIVVVCFHKGNGGYNNKLSDYERPLCHAAIDAGADMIFAQHHHMLKGIELYKGKPIYHGLGNYVCVTYHLTIGYNDTPEKRAYLVQRAKEGRGDGHYEVDFYPWAPVSRLTMLPRVLANKDGVVECGFFPCYIEKSGNVVMKNRDNGGQEVLDFVMKQSEGSELGTKFEWNEDGTYVTIH